jgi:hypothetical protein
MLARPFTTSTHHDLLPLAGTLQVSIGLVGGWTDGWIQAFSRPFRDLAAVASWGGMAGAAQPLSSRADLVVSARVMPAGDAVWSFDAAGIHPGILFVIQNLVHALHLQVTPVRSLQLRSALLRTGQPVQEELPCDHEPYPFGVEYGMESAQVSIDVDFAAPREPSSLEPFRAAWEAWEGVAILGGFADETYLPGQASLAVEDELRLTSAGLGASYDDVSIADAGFYCLVNMLEVLHHRLAPIASVAIE